MIFNAIAKISKKTALIMLFYLLGLVLIFHFLIYFEQIPYDKVWAGKLKSFEEMRAFETFSIVLNIFMLSILSIKYKLLEKNKTNRVIDLFIWIFAILYAINTLGNLFAQNILELIFGTLLTLISSILCIVIVIVKKKKIQY